MENAANQQLNKNIHQIDTQLCTMSNNIETPIVQHSAGSVLQELSRGVIDLTLNGNAPQFEFHGYGCVHAMGVPKRLLAHESVGARKKSRSHTDWRQNLNQEEENDWIQEECSVLSAEKLSSLEQIGECTERNPVIRLLELFKALHEQINADLPSHQLNSTPSDYAFELPRKSSLPQGCNVRHHLHVLCTKMERFLVRQRRILESNRHFDYNKYTECDEVLTSAFNDLHALYQVKHLELRQRNMHFTQQAGLNNAGLLEKLLIELLEHLKAAHLLVYVFNWEMDLEHRYSAAMTASLKETNERALGLAVAELQLSEPQGFSFEEQIIAEHYQLANVVSCAKEHEDFLTALLQCPEDYFPPEIIALCEPPRNGNRVPPVRVNNVAEGWDFMAFGGDIIEMAPSSPPRVNRRSHIPMLNRAS